MTMLLILTFVSLALIPALGITPQLLPARVTSSKKDVQK